MNEDKIMQFKLITEALSYRDPYAHALSTDVIVSLRARAEALGIKTVVVERLVSWEQMFAQYTKKIKEVVFEITTGNLQEYKRVLSDLDALRSTVGRGFGIERWAPLADDIVNLLKKRGLRAELENGYVLFQTRDGGDVGNESPGKRDIELCLRGKDAILAAYPTLPVQLDVVDEWVSISVSISDLEALSEDLANQANLSPVA